MFLSTYNNKPSTLEVRHEVNTNGRTGKTYPLNEFVITVWDDGEVTAYRDRYQKTSVNSVLPNMTVDEGVLRIHLEDLTALILARATPLELAEGLLTDDAVKEHLIYGLSEQYSSAGIDDIDRRKFLAKIKVAIHSIQQDKLIEKLNSIETEYRARTSILRWNKAEAANYRRLYEYAYARLEGEEAFRDFHAHFNTPDAFESLIRDAQDPVQLESVGAQWNESRDYWRQELLKHFPPNEVPISEDKDLP